MKGSLLVGVYSVILVGLFGGCCYLMTTINPDPLPEEVRRRFSVADVDPRDLPPNDNIYYGLEKIPEDVDVDEFRKQLKTTFNKHDVNIDKTFHEGAQRVIPPILPSENKVEVEINVSKLKNKTNSKALLETSSPVKGLRRSVNDTHHDQNEHPGSVLLKIIDESGRKKIEIKFLSKEKINTKRIRQTKTSKNRKLNETFNILGNLNDKNSLNITEDTKDEVIQIKADDVILLTIVSDSDVLFDDSISGTENTEHTTELIMNITEKYDNLNKTLNNSTNIIENTENRKGTA